MDARRDHHARADVPWRRLECGEAFEGLDGRAKAYAHRMARASWEGWKASVCQSSRESPMIVLLLLHAFHGTTPREVKRAASERGLATCAIDDAMAYCAVVLANAGNYRAFGSTKIVPAVGAETFERFLRCSEADVERTARLWKRVKHDVYALEPRRRQLGFGPVDGVSSYYASNVTREDAQLVQDFLDAKGIGASNTRLFKVRVEGVGNVYQLRIASARKDAGNHGDDPVSAYLGEHVFRNATIRVERGDYAKLMQRVCAELQEAKKHASNENEVSMLEHYIESFETGCVNAHKEGSRKWIRNKSPEVETYLGFIESYRDPLGVRAEWEGFVAVVNKAMSRKFQALVENAEVLLRKMPWPKEYEKDVFLRPDFTSLDLVAFASSGIPAGINIPNYDDIRQSEGFKNVSLGNVLSAKPPKERVTFLTEADGDMWQELQSAAFEIQVGLHELLGHGSGKLFTELENGQLNIDPDAVPNPIEGSPGVGKWYKKGESWDSKFQDLAAPYEECRAECTGIYLCIEEEVQRIFGHEGKDAQDLIYVNWLNMARAGLVGLEFYTPETGRWRQAHMQARYVILRVMLEAGEGFVNVQKIERAEHDGKPDILLTLDREKIVTTGKKCIGEFLLKLQVFKSMGDVESASKMFDSYSQVPADMLVLREIALERKRPRPLFVQPCTWVEDGVVKLKEFEASAEGMIESMVFRFGEHDTDLEELYLSDEKFHDL
mmetsp:Transcript_6724/g.41073  ORF Transcript_6724/g.41073 Transcript_6724/m.41073 type:complete len:722 (-) Transcript_6724:2944-5109(-)